MVTAYKTGGSSVSLYVYPADQTPRVTGGPDYADTFWTCLSGELGGGAPKGDADEKHAEDGGVEPASH